jgi:hypothetical protein
MANKISRIRFGGQPPTGSISRLIVLIVGVTLALPLVLMMLFPPRPADATSDLLPDLRMAHIQNLRVNN